MRVPKRQRPDTQQTTVVQPPEVILRRSQRNSACRTAARRQCWSDDATTLIERGSAISHPFRGLGAFAPRATLAPCCQASQPIPVCLALKAPVGLLTSTEGTT